jgi:hypothetical protein
MSVAGMRATQLLGGVRAGVLATLTMDGAMLAAGRLGGDAWASDRLGPDVIGRWAAGLVRGRWCHDDIRAEPARRGELALGLLTHYVTGIVLTEVFLLAPRHGTSGPSLLGAIGFGVATAGLPLLVLYPSLGYGPFGLRTGDAARLDRIMLLGHVAFGVGIAKWARGSSSAHRAVVEPAYGRPAARTWSGDTVRPLARQRPDRRTGVASPAAFPATGRDSAVE